MIMQCSSSCGLPRARGDRGCKAHAHTDPHGMLTARANRAHQVCAEVASRTASFKSSIWKNGPSPLET